MKKIYKGCDIEVTSEKSLSGETLIFYSVMDDGFEVTSGFSYDESTIKEFINRLKDTVDDYREHPKDYE